MFASLYSRYNPAIYLLKILIHLEMSFCSSITRNGDNGSSIEYLTATSALLKRNLQCWISSVLASHWMPLEPINETIEDNGLLYPLGIITCNFEGRPPNQSFDINFIISDGHWELSHGQPLRIGEAINPSFNSWVQNGLRHSLAPFSDEVPLFSPAPSVTPDLFWLGDFINNDIHSRYYRHLDNGRTNVQFFFGYEQAFTCRESNCILHSSWHFQFMEIFETDTQTVSSEQTDLESHFSTWVNQLTTRRFPNIAFTYSSLIGEQNPTILSSRYF